MHAKRLCSPLDASYGWFTVLRRKTETPIVDLPQSLVGRHAAISLETAEGFEDALHFKIDTVQLDGKEG